MSNGNDNEVLSTVNFHICMVKKCPDPPAFIYLYHPGFFEQLEYNADWAALTVCPAHKEDPVKDGLNIKYMEVLDPGKDYKTFLNDKCNELDVQEAIRDN